MHKFSASSTKIPMPFLTEIEKNSIKMCMDLQKISVTKVNMKKKNNSICITISSSFRARVTKTDK